MKYLNQIINQTLLIWYASLKFNIFKAFINQNKDSKNIIWLFPGWPWGFISYFATAAIIQDLSLLHSSIRNLNDYKICIGPKIGNIRNKNIFYNFTDRFNPHKFESNSRYLQSLIQALNKQGCKTYPNLNELKLWEDKEFMYSVFKEKNIPHPRTVNIKIDENLYENLESVMDDFSFPLLIKEHFGNQSKGLYFIKSKDELKNQFLALKNNHVSSASIQQLINAESDHRVIVINGKLAQHYERIRAEKVLKNSEWQTTSTKYGTILKFDTLDEKYSKIIESYSKILNLSNAAFDIIIKDEEIYVLEVSSSYYTNPKPNSKNISSYKNFKKKIFIHNRLKINIVFELKEKWFKSLIRY